jgi:hypothetical protein
LLSNFWVCEWEESSISEGDFMNIRTSVVLALLLAGAVPLSAGGKKKNGPERAMLEKMEAVPCGAKQKGLSGLGSFWASVGVTHLNSDEKLCPQYLLRTDDMDYRIRPTDLKHPVVLPVGHEIVFRIKKDRMFVKVPDGDSKMRPYEVVAEEPANAARENASAKSQ